MLRVTGVTRRFRRTQAVTGVTFDADVGVYGLLGNNGAGKSTLLKLIATVLPATSGEIRFHEHSRPDGDNWIRQRLGYLPQAFGMPEHLTAREYLRYAGAMKGLRPGDGVSSDEALATVGLEQAARRRIRTLSGGMRQRLGIAQAFLGSPELLVLDEPSAGLDPQERIRLRQAVNRIAARAVVLLSTHIVSDVERDADVVGILHAGRLVAQGTPSEVAERAAGHVFEVAFPPEEWARVAPRWLARDQAVSAAPGVVAGVAERDGEVQVRVVCNAAPPPGAVPVAPTLEDGYLAVTTGATAMAEVGA